MRDILSEIVNYKYIEVEQMKGIMSERLLHAEVERLLDSRLPSLKASLMTSSTEIIAEFKRRSPSKGWIKEDGNARVIPLGYQRAGAAAVSILTDEKFFGGADRFVIEARQSGVTVPVLYKNFIVDEYQLFQARYCGASAVLLIASVLTKDECRHLAGMAHELGMEVLLELHDEREIDYADINPDVCGVNNRNLGTFITDVNNSFRLASLLPHDVCKVSESGISSPRTIVELRQAGFNGFLIGETFMKAERPDEELKHFIGEIESASTDISDKPLRIKVCGLTEPQNVRDVVALGVDMIGFIFYKNSPRYVSARQMDSVCKMFDKEICRDNAPKRVGVFVDEPIENIVHMVKSYSLDCVQLHGNETVDQLALLRKAVNDACGRNVMIIKALSISGPEDVIAGEKYCDVADMFIFDTKGQAVGGNGKHFDWSAINAYTGCRPFFLSGGIGPDDVSEIRRLRHPKFAGIDLNSRFETSPGVKDVAALAHFIEEMRN